MSYTIHDGTVSAYRTTEVGDERPVDGEFVLPEYCPDIAAILKCFITPVVTDRRPMGDKTALEGHADIRVLYLADDRKQVYSCEFTTAFSSVVSVGEGLCVCGVRHHPEYTHCRAAGPRRVEIHGAFRLCLVCREIAPTTVITGAEGPGLFADSETVGFSAPAGCTEKSFAVNEILSLGDSTVRYLVYTRVTPFLNEYKPLKGKAILKGEMLVYTVYCDNEGALRQNEQTLAFSQIVDADGMEETSSDEVSLSVESADIRPAVDPNGENSLLSVNCRLSVSLIGCREEERTVLKDAFCTLHPLRAETQQIELRRLSAMRREAITVRETLDLPTDDLSEVVALWCEVIRAGGEGRALEGAVQLSMLCRNGEGILSFYERPVAFSQELSEDADGVIAHAAVRRTEYAPMNGKLELRVELSCLCRYIHVRTVTALTAIKVDEDTAIAPEPSGVKVYYADAGETVWEIARNCRASREQIMEENGLSGDILTEPAVLLIPIR